MRLATRALLALVLVGLLLAGALLVASAAIGPAEVQPIGRSDLDRSDGDNWRTDDSIIDALPVAIGLSDDFARAWYRMSGLRWYQLAVPVAALGLLVSIVRHVLRRHARPPLPV